jgi:hypothetical protein
MTLSASSHSGAEQEWPSSRRPDTVSDRSAGGSPAGRRPARPPTGDPTPASDRTGGAFGAVPSDLLRLCALRVVQEAGPLPGLAALNMLAPLARMLGEVPPTFPLLHELEDRGLLSASATLPRAYAITGPGRREAARLADASSEILAERLGTGTRLEALLAPHH